MKTEIPQDFIDEIASYGSDCMMGLVEALSDTEPSVSVRANRLKSVEIPQGAEIVPWCGDGWYLPCREVFTFDPAMHQGLYYVQDASSMILSHIVKRLTLGVDRGVRYLDACAAPGGKTTAAMNVLPDKSMIVSNEYVWARANVLRENIIKWGCPHCVVTRGDTLRLGKLSGFFDIIAADVPCSGEGMFRKEAEAVSQWSRSLVDECVSRQREIIDNLWEGLVAGGYFIYSTCTFNRHEDENMVQYIIDRYGAESVDMEFPKEWNIVGGIDTQHHCYRFLPHKIKGEGLFVAVLRKPEDANVSQIKIKKGKTAVTAKIPDAMLKTARQWLINSADYDFLLKGDLMVAYPKCHNQEMAMLSSQLDVIYAGITLGTVKGKDLIPAQSLALSTELNGEAFAKYELDYATAIDYLRREAITLEDAPRGYVLVTYGGRPLGFVKNLGNRANNLYPQEWRILSAYRPETAPKII